MRRAYWWACLFISVTAFIGAANYATPQGIINPCTIAPSSTIFGCVKPDGTTITNTAGAISVTYGTGAATAAQGNDARFGLKSKSFGTSRDLTAATGSQAVTGAGFVPTSCILQASVQNTALTTYTTFSGFVDSARTMSNLSTFAATTNIDTSKVLLASDATGANRQEATVASYDADGLTLSWTKTGTPTGTFFVNFLCFR